jgi:GYF domain
VRPPWHYHVSVTAQHASLPYEHTICWSAARMWEYQDLDGQTHGPFTSDKMRQWTAKGYFQSDLQACTPLVICCRAELCVSVAG